MRVNDAIKKLGMKLTKAISYKASYRLKKGIYSGLSLSVGLCVVLSFQNCADLDQSQVVSVTDIEEQTLAGLPFAYDAKIDQMAYMSCSGQFGQDPRAFTIKAGGYFPNSGVALRSNFLSQISQMNADTKSRSLALSDRNSQAGVMMNIRPRSNLQDYLEPTGNEGGEITSASMMNNTTQGVVLSNERVAKQLLALGPGGYLNYVAGIPGLFPKTFDGVLRINNTSGVENSIRNILRNTHYVALTYPEELAVQTDPLKPNRYVRSPYGTTTGDNRALTSVFGTGYQVNFQQFDARMSTAPSRVMTVQGAINLENNSSLAESWDCSERFVIVRPEDADRLTYDRLNTNSITTDDETVCDTKSDDIPANFTQQQRWDRIRNILPVEDWYVNLPCPATGAGPPGCRVGFAKAGCIIPKSNDFCYDMDELTGGSNDPNIKIAYFYEEDLDRVAPLSPAFNYTGTCGPGTFFVCPHYVTICHKR